MVKTAGKDAEKKISKRGAGGAAGHAYDASSITVLPKAAKEASFGSLIRHGTMSQLCTGAD